jgi:hypothetical protein
MLNINDKTEKNLDSGNTITLPKKIISGINFKREYLDKESIENVKNIIINKLNGRPLNELEPLEFETLRYKIYIRFINKNINNLDLFLERVKILNVTDKDCILISKLAAIYLGDVGTLSSYFDIIINNTGSEYDTHQKIHYELIPIEIGILMDKIRCCLDNNNYETYKCSDGDIKSQKIRSDINYECKNKKHNVSIVHPIVSSIPIPIDVSPPLFDYKHEPYIVKSNIRSRKHSTDISPLLHRIKDSDCVPVMHKKIHDKKTNSLFMESLVNNIKEKTNKYYQQDILDKNKTNISDIKIAAFRLIVGVAYKTSGINNTVNTKDVKNESYKFIDLIMFTNQISELLFELDIIDEDHYTYLVKIVGELQSKYDIFLKNDQKINSEHKHASTNNGYLYGKIDDKIKQKLNLLDKNNCDCEQVIRNRIKTLNCHKSSLPYIPFKDRYSRVFIEKDGNILDDTLINNGFWYDEFLPMILKGLSIDPVIDDELYRLLDLSNTCHDDSKSHDELEILLSEWFDSNYEKISTVCDDVTYNFDYMSNNEKIIIKQCWDMSVGYLLNLKNDKLYLSNDDIFHNGSDYKCYSISECDKVTNNLELELELDDSNNILTNLSQYVPFIDEYFGKQYVTNKEMYFYLPKYISHPTWKLLHAIPELIEKKICYLVNDQDKERIVQNILIKFTTFFKNLSMYIL